MRLIKLIMSVVLISLMVVINITAGNGKTNTVQKSDVKTVPGQFIVKFKAPNGDGAQVAFSKLSSVAARYNTTSNKQVFAEAKNVKIKNRLNLGNVYLFVTDKGKDIQQIVNELNRDPSIEYAEPVYICKQDAEPNDPRYSDQFQFPQIKAPEAWDIKFGSSDIIIGVIDSGVDWDHEDLAVNIWNNSGEIPDNGIDDDGNGFIDDIRGWDFVTGVTGTDPSDADPNEDGDVPDNDPMDFGGHGTHVAGISGAVTNNEIGIASASAGATIMPIRIGWRSNDGNGYGRSEWMAAAHIYAADNGASVTNLSYGNSGQVIVDAAYYAFLNGVLVVESAGNGDAIDPSILGSQDFVISVASVNHLDKKADYSSYGEYVEVSAPGGEMSGLNTLGILSTIINPSDFYGGNLYTYFQGTSMAAPLVASAAALVKSNDPSLSVLDLFTRIVETADDLDALNPAYEGLLGSGRINLHRALTEQVDADPQFKIVSSEIDDASGNGDGFLDPGEQVVLNVRLRNFWEDAANVSVELSGGTSWPVSVVSGISNLGNVT
ncbi:MAG: S8 family serine peptidase, partial [Melioribacteraceae bacterium]|nr:S8 family serine peptidase [Melioribacteraceae bacterium]